MKRFLHVLDVVSVIGGALLLLNGGEAQAATGMVMAAIPGLGLSWTAVVGSVMVMLPMGRRVVHGLACEAGALPEVQDMSQALIQVALAQRVASANLHMTGLPDHAWRRLFPTDEALWAYFGPCFDAPALRAQMHPVLRSRLAALRCQPLAA